MINILLICSAGMSTSMLVRKMQDAASARGVEANIWAVGDAQASIEITKADVVLLGPQIRFQKAKMQELAGNKPVQVIDMAAYGSMNGDKVLDSAFLAYNQTI